MRRHSALFAAVVALAGLAAPAMAVEAPFQPRLLRLAEVLGSLHYLRNLCGEEGTLWRDQMQRLIDAENPAPDLLARYVASFNRGYRSYEGTYVKCTASATEAIARFMKEGEELSRDIAVRFGN
ncbi:MAG TPA: TIGR02301 family protein [Rhizobiales bacterium]|nr:TIGR02301 family protein [Hyphomicrobiales bacterium]